LETAVGLAFDLVHSGLIDLERLVEMCSTNPARIFGLTDRGSLKANAHADITLLDPNLEWVFDVKRSKSKSRNTPFHGRRMVGAAVATIVGGRIVYLHPDYTRINETEQKFHAKAQR
jgi:dihydroorotase